MKNSQLTKFLCTIFADQTVLCGEKKFKQLEGCSDAFEFKKTLNIKSDQIVFFSKGYPLSNVPVTTKEIEEMEGYIGNARLSKQVIIQTVNGEYSMVYQGEIFHIKIEE